MNKARVEKYRECCKKFTPVFHHFFLENFPSPSVLFIRRQAYTHSLSASSVIGWIVGLGDRHAQNILLDKGTGEVVHIDLGIAFEQGTMLQIPEVVPFRLTRDIVDGLGVLGIEGGFRRCAIECMRVCRHAKDTIMAVFEVLLHDPLYSWAETDRSMQVREVSDVQAGPKKPLIKSAMAQSPKKGPVMDKDVERNKDAQRVLLRVQDKLNGIVGKDILREEEHVEVLVREAQDVNQLGRMYYGWSAWV
jgi:ataxia telangiectasia mutated family protein